MFKFFIFLTSKSSNIVEIRKRVLQQSTVSNRFIQSSIEWESTSTQDSFQDLAFHKNLPATIIIHYSYNGYDVRNFQKLTSALENHLSHCHDNVENICGPLWYKQYYNWTSRSKNQFTNDRIKRILEKYPQTTSSRLTPDQGGVLKDFDESII